MLELLGQRRSGGAHVAGRSADLGRDRGGIVSEIASDECDQLHAVLGEIVAERTPRPRMRSFGSR